MNTPPSCGSPDIAFRDVSFSYDLHDGALVPVLHSLTTHFRLGEVTAVMGASGSGKSTLGKLLSGQMTPLTGDISLPDTLLAERDRFYIDQNPDKVVFPWLTVIENLRQPLKSLGWTEPAIRSRVEELLEDFELGPHASRFPLFLSGGQKSRLALARALSWKPRCVILDEYLADLDLVTKERIITVLRKHVTCWGITVLLITHDPSDVAALSDRCLVLSSRPGGIASDIDIGAARQHSTDLELRSSIFTSLVESAVIA